MSVRRPSPATVQARLIVLLEKNLAAMERLTEALARPGLGLPQLTARQAGLLTQADVCALLGVTRETLYRRIWRGRFPRPVHGRGKNAVWRVEDVRSRTASPAARVARRPNAYPRMEK